MPKLYFRRDKDQFGSVKKILIKVDGRELPEHQCQTITMALLPNTHIRSGHGSIFSTSMTITYDGKHTQTFHFGTPLDIWNDDKFHVERQIRIRTEVVKCWIKALPFIEEFEIEV